MKKIEAIIRPEKADEVRELLKKVGYAGLMVSEIEGHGKQRGKWQVLEGEKSRMELLAKTRLEMIVRDEDAEKIIRTIISAARTGEPGDGKIFIYPMEDVIHIRTEERGEDAV